MARHGGNKTPFDHLFGGITDLFNSVCEPQVCAPRSGYEEHDPAAPPPKANDARFKEMGSDEGIQRSFLAFSSVSKITGGRTIERSSFPAYCRHFFTRVDPAYELSSDDMNLLWEFFDRQKEGSLDLFQFGMAVKKLLSNRAGKQALIMVDFQNDFVDGSLKVEGGLDAVKKANTIRDKFSQDLIFLTRDWHPPDHMSFNDNHGAEAFSSKRLPLPNGETTDQIMWPRHCVAASQGAQWCPFLVVKDTDMVIDKGLNPKVDSYSGFFDNCKGHETKLQAILRARGVSDVYVVGLAYDYCVGFTAIDAKSCGFTTYVLDDCTRAVNKDSQVTMDGRLASEKVTRIDSSAVPLPAKTSGSHMMATVRQLLAR
mmetsp:Transcript_70209/g.102894  ORF Transcript_70209/g.102894 Transcript_70209/m.102894 type:complete len:370 (+) Transcript_70209:174-1283(+)|eukprot:CAMPEP_0179432360 /NCGR_PEP_ID=MMETSP0799-20121207/16992_1 /TAXON_ID=46947 /ORGANISM="Geminigera cryophila, Strain CCMP2564" /LENGTH=369 /DNA_ID=CAMNT_0021209697 /DNA_START=223 /DNA_END=1332 /DNA_ORIENTATION=-